MQAAWLSPGLPIAASRRKSGTRSTNDIIEIRKNHHDVLPGLAFVGSSFAADAHKANFQISQSVQVNGTELAPGDYVAKWTGDGPDVQVSITRNGKEMATVPAKLVQLDRKSTENASEIRANGSGRELRQSAICRQKVFAGNWRWFCFDFHLGSKITDTIHGPEPAASAFFISSPKHCFEAVDFRYDYVCTGLVYTASTGRYYQSRSRKMRLDPRQITRATVALLLATLFFLPGDLLAQSHVVSPADLQKQVISASQTRENNLQNVQKFLSTPVAEKAMKSANMNPQQVKTAVSTLSDQELAQLSAKADKAQADFAAGNLNDRDLILIILAIAVLVLIIVAVR